MTKIRKLNDSLESFLENSKQTLNNTRKDLQYVLENENYKQIIPDAIDEIKNLNPVDKYGFVNSLAQLSLAVPVFTFLDNYVSGFTPDESISANIVRAVLTFAGFGKLDGKFRDYVRDKFKVTNKTDKERLNKIDRRSKMAFNIFRAGIIYGSGLKASQPEKIAKGVGTAIGYGKFFGAKSAYLADLYSYLTNLKEIEQIPNKISYKVQNLSSFGKKALLGTMILSSLSLSYGINKTSKPIKDFCKSKISTNYENLKYNSKNQIFFNQYEPFSQK